jgi:hypothetical protein
MVEVLIASVLLLTVILGVLPFLTRSILNNISGQDSVHMITFARTRAEELFQAPFNHADLEILAGTDRQHFEVYRNDVWEPATDLDPPLPDGTEWTRETTIHQYNIADLDDPLPAGSDPGQIHVKEIEVVLRSTRRGGPLGPGRTFGVRLFKSQ